MKAYMMAIVAAAGILAAAPGLARSGGATPAFAGHWQVTGVAVPDDGVQALADNDPSYMGKRLTFSVARLAWDKPVTTNDVCVSPQFTRTGDAAFDGLRPRLRKLGLSNPTPFAVHCLSGTWGPGNAVVFRGAGGALAMPWYDGGLLKLHRVERSLGFEPTIRTVFQAAQDQLL